MAADSEAKQDMRAHEGSYNIFVGMMKWGTILSAIVAMIVIYVIAN